MKNCLVCGKEFQPPITGGRPPEICSPECTTVRKRQHREESRQRAIDRGQIPAKAHGTSTGATYYGCTCNRCRKWAREYKQSRRTILKAAANE